MSTRDRLEPRRVRLRLVRRRRLEHLVRDAVVVPPLAGVPRHVPVHHHLRQPHQRLRLRVRLAGRQLEKRRALDGFGAEGASLALLHGVDPDAVKLDPALTASLLDDVPTQRLVRSIVASAVASGTPVIGTNLEVPAMAKTLLSLGCTLGQGNLFGAPSPPRTAFGVPTPVRNSTVASSLL